MSAKSTDHVSKLSKLIKPSVSLKAVLMVDHKTTVSKAKKYAFRWFFIGQKYVKIVTKYN